MYYGLERIVSSQIIATKCLNFEVRWSEMKSHLYCEVSMLLNGPSLVNQSDEDSNAWVGVKVGLDALRVRFGG
jgi:hypothetical protein